MARCRSLRLCKFLGLLDLIQIAARGLSPRSQYEVYVAESVMHRLESCNHWQF